VECVRRHSCHTAVSEKRQADARRISSVRTFPRRRAATISELSANLSRDRPARLQAVARLEQLRVHVCVTENLRQEVLRVLQRLLLERQVSLVTHALI